jgi:hypothetical protein
MQALLTTISVACLVGALEVSDLVGLLLGHLRLS